MLIDRLAVGAHFCIKPEGEARWYLISSSPKGIRAEIRDGGGGFALFRGLAVIVDGPQVEKEARYKPVGCLEGALERARNTNADLR